MSWLPLQRVVGFARRPRRAHEPGAARFVERPELLSGTSRLDIVLTHFHLDHIAGLAYLPALGLCEQTTIWGPGKLLYDISTEELLVQVSRQPFHPVPLAQQDI